MVPDGPKRNTPPFGRPRIQSDTERTIDSLAAKRQREAEREPQPFTCEDITAQYERGEITLEQLHEGRKDLDVGVRVGKLETKMDTLVADFGTVKAAVAVQAQASTDQGAAIKSVDSKLDKLLEHQLKRHELVLKTEARVQEADAIADIAIDQERKTGAVKKSLARHEWVTKAIAIIGALATAFAAGRC